MFSRYSKPSVTEDRCENAYVHRLWSQLPPYPRKQAEVLVELKFFQSTSMVSGCSFPPCTAATAISTTLHVDHLSQAFAEVQTVNLHFLSVMISPRFLLHILARSRAQVHLRHYAHCLIAVCSGERWQSRKQYLLPKQPLTSPRGRR